MDHPSVTTWLGLIQQGDETAAQRLWERYFTRLVELARGRMRGMAKRVADEEDVALVAFDAFFRAVQDGRIPRLSNRDDFWRTLVLLVAGKAVDQRRREQSAKRGGRIEVTPMIEEVIGHEPDPAFALQLADELGGLMARLDGDALRDVALLKLEGFTNEEIAAKLDCTGRTVTRMLTVIRRVWEEAPV